MKLINEFNAQILQVFWCSLYKRVSPKSILQIYLSESLPYH